MKPKILVAITAFNCEQQINSVVNQYVEISQNLFSQLLIIDNKSLDNTANAIQNGMVKYPNIPIALIKNRKNFGLGGSHKIAFLICLEKQFDGVVILHGDNQAQLSDFSEVMAEIDIAKYDALLGSRFMRSSRLYGYSRFRIIGNKIFNYLYTLIANEDISDMGSGLNYFSKSVLSGEYIKRMPDDLTFNPAFMLSLYILRKKIKFFPISWREDGQISNARLFQQALLLLNYIIWYFFKKETFLTKDYRKNTYVNYEYEVIGRTESSII